MLKHNWSYRKTLLRHFLCLSISCWFGSSVWAEQVSNEVIVFETTNQSMWGPGEASPDDVSIRVLGFDWDEGFSAQGKQNIPPFGNFGGGISASSHGGIGFDIVLSDISTGSLAVESATRFTYRWQDEDTYLPTQYLEIDTACLLYTSPSPRDRG